ncbi:MAG: NAD(+) synthase [Lachnospiraceae bacterium]|nr:NAD(+) synthase [Lachnospiraceae bacterium]
MLKEGLIDWVRDYFKKNGNCKAVVGISGGTDSSVTAAVLCEAIGKENVIGVLMPNGDQHDIDVSLALVKHLGIEYHVVNIKNMVEAVKVQVAETMNCDPNLTDAYKTNTPARLRMTVLYGICALVGGRVANTCNLSEDYVGYSTKYGDAAGDFSVLSSFTKTEVREIGRELGLPAMFVEKVPEDGMSGKSDEERLGFTYATLDHYIRTGVIESEELKENIERKHRANLHKMKMMPVYDYMDRDSYFEG